MIGFIGCGNMGSAVMGAMIEKGVCGAHEVLITDKFAEVVADRQRRYGVTACTSIAEVVRQCKYVFLCVKPQDAVKVMAEVIPVWKSDQQILVSICAGTKIATLEQLLPDCSKVVRVMPNTPCLVSRMAAGFSTNSNITPEDAAAVDRMLAAAGAAYRIPEALLDPVTGLSGSGPAYVAHLIEAFATAGKNLGIPEDVAFGLTLETFIGTAELMRQKHLSPEQLKIMVTSPNGTTYAGRQVLEASDVADVINGTIKAGCARSIELGLAKPASAKRACK